MPNSRESETGHEPWSAGDHGEPDAASSTGTAESPREPPDPAAELARIEDRYKRALADLDNYRKRSARELDRRVTDASDASLRDWLAALDSVELALAMDSDGPCREGMQAILDQMNAILARRGVERVARPGEQFDPERHEAIGVEVTDRVPSRTISSVERSGFAVGDRVIRPAQVVVTRAPERTG
ncbi:MAG TPA: nucleotide exchange factor GrpE [Solirubrobacteraceae bacterium]|jgi:molecular chaperone GrpE|nr:nucleotide exchange factor GrpE [Solirubrobacteraceae bacterium]